MRTVFLLALRQTVGLIASLLRPLGLDLAAPDHSTISRRGKTFPVSRPRPGVIVLVSGRWMSSATIDSPVETAQIPPTILAAMGLDPEKLIAVQNEGTQVLPGLSFESDKPPY
jgi:hypothetical protein